MVKIEFWRDIPNPLGRFRLAVDPDGGVHGGWHHVGRLPDGGLEDADLLPDLASWVEATARGLTEPPPPFQIPAGPEFFTACWNACQVIPVGSVLSYQQLACAAGRPAAHRAAGAAMRHNPSPLLIPCHRVIRSNGHLGGFAGRTDSEDAALILKNKLLKLEDSLDDQGRLRGYTLPLMS